MFSMDKLIKWLKANTSPQHGGVVMRPRYDTWGVSLHINGNCIELDKNGEWFLVRQDDNS